jgi:hypothetical protein
MIALESEIQGYLPHQPWRRKPLVNWYEMNKFTAENAYALGLFLDRLRSVLTTMLLDRGGNYSEAMTNEERQKVVKELQPAEALSLNLGLKQTTQAIQDFGRVLARFDGYKPVHFYFEDITNRIDELHRVITREMQSHLFMFFTPEQAEWYLSPSKGWEEVVKKWPQTAIDIEESSKCYACDRYAAAIFHTLLVAEFGVIQLAQLLGDVDPKPGWAMLDRLEKIIRKPYPQRSPLEQQHSKLLDNTMPLMQTVKDSWRHKITHVDNKLKWLDGDFSPQLAEEIIKSTRGLMRRLAEDMP